MKKSKQYSDKYGKIVEVGEVPEKRENPGVTMLEGVYEVPERTGSAPWTAEGKAAPVAEVEEVEEVVEDVEEEEVPVEDE